MKSLYEHYQALKESYYQITIDTETMFDGFSGREHCRTFIDEHFTKGNKLRVFSIPESYIQTYRVQGKHQHSVSLYLLGLLFKNTFTTQLEKSMQELFDVKEWYQYEYTWYLTCLYHDVTSVIEKDEAFAYRADIVGVSRLFDQDNKLLRFPKDVYINYALYRQNCGSAEHGIIAGTELFDRLHESFSKKTAGHDWSATPICRKRNLVWRKEHLPHFAYIADAICCHNIWLAPKKNKALCQKYQDHSLDELIINQQSDKLSLQEYPLQFMLCLLDTMEPIKRFKDLAPDEILKNIYLDFYGEGLTLGWTPLIKEQPQFFDWLRPIATIGEWMQISGASCVHNDDLCSITLSWNNEQTKRGK